MLQVGIARPTARNLKNTITQREGMLNIGEIVSQLKAERSRIDKAITALEGALYNLTGNNLGHRDVSARTQKRGHLSPEGRKRISEMMTKRWAERREKLTVKK